MRQQFNDKNKIQHVMNGLNKLYNRMIETQKVDVDEIKSFMEPYFEEAGYRESVINKTKFSKSKSTVKNILIIHDAGIGDFIILSAFFREVRRIYSDSHITLVIHENSLSIAKYCPYIDDVIIFNDNSKAFNYFFKFYESALKIANILLKYKFDVAFNLGQRPSTPLLAYMSGAKEIVGQLFRGNSYRDFEVGNLPIDFFDIFVTFFPPKGLTKPHYNDQYLYILQKYTKNNINNKKLEFWLSPKDNFEAEMLLQDINGEKLYAIAMGSNEEFMRKRWAPENYAKLINIILKDHSAKFVILGGKSELESAKTVKSLVEPKYIIDLTDKLNFRQSVAVLNLCDCYIGNDTGMMHAAAALKIPVLTPNCFPADIQMTFLSFTNQYYPYGVPSVIVQPKHALPECKDTNDMNVLSYTTGCKSDKPHCINQITPETMFQALMLLNKQIAKGAKEPCYFK